MQHDPWSSTALCLLGNAQLSTFESDETRTELLKWAEKSYRASIACEGEPVEQAGAPVDVSNQDWWMKEGKGDKDKGSKDSSKSPPPKTTVSPTSKSTGPKSTPTTKSVPSKKQPVPQKTSSKVASSKPTQPSSSKAIVSKTSPASKTAAGVKPGAKPTEPKGKGVATLGELKTKTTPTAKTSPAQSQAQRLEDDRISQSSTTVPPGKSTDIATKAKGGILNKKTYNARLGLARVLLKQKDQGKALDEAVSLYKEVFTMAPEVHDAYIELGEVLAKKDPLGAVEVYSKYPFSDNPTFDDGYLYGEIARILMAAEKYTDPWLERSMIALGRILGIGALEKQFTTLETKFQTNLLKNITAGIHGKSVDDPALQAFFKFKCWS